MYSTIQKTIAAWAFNHYIAYYYFDNVNVSQLKVAFEKGEVELEHLPIKKDALRHFKLPMDVVSGIVGKLSIKVPLLTMLTDPWVIKIKNVMLIVEPKKLPNSITANNNNNLVNLASDETETTTTNYNNASLKVTNLTKTPKANDSIVSDISDRSQFDLSQDNGPSSLADQTDKFLPDVNSEETKLAEFYSSFSATVSSMVKDIYKNIRLEIESMTILFEDFDHGLVKLGVDSLLLHRPRLARNLELENLAIYLSRGGPRLNRGEDLLLISADRCNLDIHDEASNSMQIDVVQTNQDTSSTSGSSFTSSTNTTTSSTTLPRLARPHSGTKIEGSFLNVHLKQVTNIDRNNHAQRSEMPTKQTTNSKKNKENSVFERSILECDTIRLEMKLNHIQSDELINISFEKNLHLQLDLIGMQYIHSHRIYESTLQRLKNLLKFFVRLHNRKPDESNLPKTDKILTKSSEKILDNYEDSNFNKLLIVNIKEGLLYMVDDESSTCAIPLLEVFLDDCRVFRFSGKHQQNGFVFAKIGCNHYNREISSWDTLLRPWQFNLTWDLNSEDKRLSHRQVNLSSDELANLTLSSSFLDLYDVALRRVIDGFIHPRYVSNYNSIEMPGTITCRDFNSIFVIHNETGHRLEFATLDQPGELYQLYNDEESNRSSPTGFSFTGDELPTNSINKLSIHSRSSVGSRDSPSLDDLAGWTSVDVDETISFAFEALPIYRRRPDDLTPRSRILFVRVEGWKILEPILIDRTGLMYREARSDRVLNEDTVISISIDMEEGSARKVISVRSPLSLVNQLDATLEVQFVESKQALYVKPDSRMTIPLPYLYDRIHVRPCNVGVTMSDAGLTWPEIQQVTDIETRVFLCRPITITNLRHQSYCQSEAYRLCVSLRHDYDPSEPDVQLPVYLVTFTQPMDVDSLNCSIEDTYDPMSRGSTKKTHLTSYNYNANLAERMSSSAVSLFKPRAGTSDIKLIMPGIKLTLVNRYNEHLLETLVEDIDVHYITKAREQILDCSVQNIRINNLLVDSEKHIVLERGDCQLESKPALRLIMDRVLGNSFGITLFRQVQLSLCELVLNIEEKLALKLVEFVKHGTRHTRRPQSQNQRGSKEKKVNSTKDFRMSKYYFDLLRIDISSVKLSVFTSTNLSSALQKLRSQIGLKCFGFEDAQVHLSSYIKMNVSRTFRDVFESMARFYKRQILEQAPSIFGQQIQNYLRIHLSDFLSTIYDEVYNTLFN